MDKHRELQTVAYELLHYHWSKMSEQERSQTAQTMQQFHDNSPEMRYLTKDYIGDPDTIADERHSTACVLIHPDNLTPMFNDYCNQLIPNRGILF